VDVQFEVETVVQQIVAFATSYGLQIVGAILILVVGRLAAGFSRRSVRKFLNFRHVDKAIVSFVSSLVYFVILTVTVLAALSKFGIQTTSFIAVLGAAGFAVGLALQGSLSNFAAGVLLLLFRPFKIGDSINAAGVEGSVQDIHLFVTEIATADNIQVIVPNSAIMSGTIMNLTGYDKRRVDVVMIVGAGASLDQVRELIRGVLDQDPDVLKTPPPEVLVKGLGAGSVELIVRVWASTAKHGAMQPKLTEELRDAFAKAQVVPPPPPLQIVRLQRDDVQ
jgi:small conductance mechanosensitive channel